MNRNTRLLIVMGIAVVTAALASFGIYEAIRLRPVPTPDPPVAVVVAKQPIEMGVSLTEAHVKLIEWPPHSQVAGAFAKIDDVVNRGLVAGVAENEPITEGKLAPRQAGAGLPPAIRPGMRAMSVKVNEVIGVAGFVTPGTRVDVIVTLHEEKDSLSRVVVSNVQVLTAGTRYDEAQAKKDGKAIPSTVVTLMVSPADAERIALAANEGQIMLALRNPLDKDATPTVGVRTGGLKGQVAAAPPAPPVRGPVTKAAPVPKPVVERKVFKKCVAGKCTEEVL
jgi:pilus assembly protein CpaB